MNQQERKKIILAELQQHQTAKIITLSNKMKVSRETIRKDISTMESEGLLKKIHGGAVLDVQPRETDYQKRTVEGWPAKQTIAKRALTYIESGDTIYLDYGTTVLALAEAISQTPEVELTVVTNSLPIVNVLLPLDHITVIIPGGLVRANEGSLSGQFATNNLENIFVTLGFFGCSGIDEQAAVTNHHIGESLFSKQMIAHCQTTILLADQSKFGNVAFNRIAKFNQVDVLISDCQNESITGFLEEQNIDVLSV